MFTSDVRKNRWDVAQLDADAMLWSKHAETVKTLLRADFKAVNGGGAVNARALLCGVVMHQFELSEIDAATGKALIDRVKGRGRFADLRILLIQQADLEDIVAVLRASVGASV
ncbi:hypothetical protein M2390_000321 [Mycetocola sp. BIGb0189]|uniref:hypothetical protein n=1 Tax=Mycetocola sp. BIGb0189 TaxID=2940604 RepID=UPI002168449F|nr:hypothetical protein [Mycetocola sp. BIGb0189]MCS4275163.1 hypothetical protein [Mycetocola sp. BIGb0189]